MNFINFTYILKYLYILGKTYKYFKTNEFKNEHE
jgi:hypothetical protein